MLTSLLAHPRHSNHIPPITPSHTHTPALPSRGSSHLNKVFVLQCRALETSAPLFPRTRLSRPNVPRGALRDAGRRRSVQHIAWTHVRDGTGRSRPGRGALSVALMCWASHDVGRSRMEGVEVDGVRRWQARWEKNTVRWGGKGSKAAVHDRYPTH